MSNDHFKKNMGNWLLKQRRPMAAFRNGGQTYRAMYKAGNAGNQIHYQTSVLETGDPEPGDLVLVPCEMWLSAHTAHTKPNCLPDNLAVKFITVDQRGNPRQGSAIRPLIELFCVEDLDGFLSLTEADYEDSMQQTKLWSNKPKYPGLIKYDYIQKRGADFFETLHTDKVDLFLIAWHENDIISVVPGIVEMRTRRNWFAADTYSQNMYKSLEHAHIPISSEIELPVVGMVGTLLQKRLITHGYDTCGNIVVGTGAITWFYNILLRDRRPMWFTGPVWKAPEELVLPIYLPIP